MKTATRVMIGSVVAVLLAGCVRGTSTATAPSSPIVVAPCPAGWPFDLCPLPPPAGFSADEVTDSFVDSQHYLGSHDTTAEGVTEYFKEGFNESDVRHPLGENGRHDEFYTPSAEAPAPKWELSYSSDMGMGPRRANESTAEYLNQSCDGGTARLVTVRHQPGVVCTRYGRREVLWGGAPSNAVPGVYVGGYIAAPVTADHGGVTVSNTGGPEDTSIYPAADLIAAIDKWTPVKK